MIFHGICNESLRLQIAGSLGQAQKSKDRNANRLLMFLEVKSTSGWWVTFDTTVTIGDMKRLREWFNILSRDKSMENRRLRLGKEALSFGYYPVRDSRSLLFIHFSQRLMPGRKRAGNGEFYSAKTNHVMCRFKRADLKRIAATLRRELSRHTLKQSALLKDYFKPLKIEHKLVN